MLRKLQGSSTAFLICRVMASPLLLAFIFLVILESPATANLTIDEVYSREELVKMAGYGEDKISTVLIEGEVVCQTCSDGDESSSLHPISGASVGILCSRSGRRASFSSSSWVKGSTDEDGGFLIDLPSHLHAIPNLENACLVRVLHLPKASICTQHYYYSRAPKHKGIQLIGVEEGTRTYTTHTIHLTPKSCNHTQQIK
ncbi:PREDICTED: uncharacterized protein LOC109174501 [Ipomoea nil]|uniref:uncharacterized protein LOC109174501 n=1 Tax=Ipomoea nil TaxID=35883 RepID=UPI000900BF63|nr:PREDICTED: uncharacterized protein LOC109174501 [Ipomoea nil]